MYATVNYVWSVFESRFRSRIPEFEHGDLSSSYVKFNILTFQKKNIIYKTSFLNDESLCYPLRTKSFKLANKREEGWNNIGIRSSNFSSDFA